MHPISLVGCGFLHNTHTIPHFPDEVKHRSWRQHSLAIQRHHKASVSIQINDSSLVLSTQACCRISCQNMCNAGKVIVVSMLEPKHHTYRIEIMNETSSSSIPKVRHVDLLIILVFQVYFKLFLKEAISFTINYGGRSYQALEAESRNELIVTLSSVTKDISKNISHQHIYLALLSIPFILVMPSASRVFFFPDMYF